MSNSSFRVTGYRSSGEKSCRGHVYESWDSKFEQRWFASIHDATTFVAKLLVGDFDEEYIEVLEDTSEDGGYDGALSIFLNVNVMEKAKVEAEYLRKVAADQKKMEDLRKEEERKREAERAERIQLEALKRKYETT